MLWGIKKRIQERTNEANRLQKTPERGNGKLTGVATDVLAVSGRAILSALLNSERDHVVLADLA